MIATLSIFGLSDLCLTQSVVIKLYGAPINLTSRRSEFYMPFSLEDSAIPTLEKYTNKPFLLVAHQEHSSTEQRSTLALRYSRHSLTMWFLRDPYEVFARSVQDLGFAREGSRARHSRLLYLSLLCPTDLSTLLCSRLLYSTLFYSSLLSSRLCSNLFYCSLLCPKPL